MFPMTHGIVDQVVWDLHGQWVDQYLHPSGPLLERHPFQVKLDEGLRGLFAYRYPSGCLAPYVLVILCESDLLLR
jgi:hypothetical protein